MNRFKNLLLTIALLGISFSATAQLVTYNYTPKTGFPYTVEILLQKTTGHTAESGKKVIVYDIKLVKVAPVSNNLHYAGKSYAPAQYGNKCAAGNWTGIDMVHIKSNLPGDVVVGFKSIGEVVQRSFQASASGFSITSLSISENVNDCVAEIRNKAFEASKKDNQANAPKSSDVVINDSPGNRTLSNAGSNTTDAKKNPVTATPAVNYTDAWNKQVAQDKQNYDQAVDLFSNTLSQWSENKRQERIEEQEQQEQKDREAYNRQIDLLNRVNGRQSVVARFPAKDIPLVSKEKAQKLYYFVYAFDNLNTEHPIVFASNVFEIGTYADGTRAYTATVKNEITSLTPFAETLHGYYLTQDEAEEALQDFTDGLQNNRVTIMRLTYKGKPTTSNTENNGSKYEKVIGAPAKINTQPTNGVAPNNKVNKASTNKDEKIIH